MSVNCRSFPLPPLYCLGTVIQVDQPGTYWLPHYGIATVSVESRKKIGNEDECYSEPR
jgi:hypothetical protein